MTSKSTKIILVCGGRDYTDAGRVWRCLGKLLEKYPDMVVLHGGCKGADLTAAEWARKRGVHTAEVKALWNSYGKSAGFKRNAAMLAFKPDFCVAFPGGNGTDMMVELCQRKGIQVWKIE